jgi:hypothetical protein
LAAEIPQAQRIYRLKFPIALDQPNPASPIPHTMERYKMRGTPSLVLIHRHGLVRKHAFGAVDDLRPTALQQKLRRLLQG